MVDVAIIDVENVVLRLRENSVRPETEGLSALEIVIKASSEIRGSVVFATPRTRCSEKNSARNGARSKGGGRAERSVCGRR